MLQCKTKWKKKKLGNLGYTYSGLSNKTIDDFGSGEDFIPYMNIYKNSIIKTDKFEQVKIGLNERQNQVQCGDVFFTTSSETPDEVGLTSVLIDSIDKPLYLNSFCFGFRLNDNNEFDNKFLAYLLRGENIRSQISKMAQGSTRYNLSKTQLLDKLNLYYPENKEEQSKMADILLNCDKVIEKTEETIEKYKQIKAGMMQNLFTRGLDENGKLRPTYAQAPDLYKYSEELDRYIPKDWNVKRLDEIGEMKSGDGITAKNIFITGMYPVYGGNGLRGYTSNYTHEGEYVLIGRQGALCGNINKASGKFFASEHAVVVTLYDDNDVNWVFYKYTDLNLNQYSEASAQPGLSVQKISKIKIDAPKGPEQKNISIRLNLVDKKIKLEEQYLNKYKHIKQGLMQQLVTPPDNAEIVEE